MSAVHGVHVVGFSAASPWKPAAHSQIRSVVGVPAVLVMASAAQAETGAHTVLPREPEKVTSATHGVHVVGFSAASPAELSKV